MFYDGKQKRNLRKFSFLAIFFSMISFCAQADFSQFVPKQKGMKTLDETETSPNHYSPEVKENYLKSVETNEKSGHVIGDRTEKIDFKNVPLRGGVQAMGALEKEKGFVEYKKADLLKEKDRKGDSSFTFTILQDDFDYDDGRGTFERIYTEPSGVSKGAYLIISRESYLARGYLDFFWKGSLGVGLSYGQGTFSNGEKADANFRLWKIPVDLGLGVALPMGRWFSVSAAGGGSAIGLLQNRSDVNKRNERRNRRQMSLGHFVEAKFKVNLSTIFKDASFQLLREFDISNFYLDFVVREQSYEGFKEENLSITGRSMGVGFSFEFL